MKKFQSTSSLLTLLVVGFVALFAVGCGDDREDFVVTNNNQAIGNMVFRFQQAAAQAVDVVPNGTTTLRFDFFSTSPPAQNSLVFTETRAFAQTVTFNNVPTTVRSVLVTAFGANNLPLATLASGDLTLNAGGTLDVNLNDAAPVSASALTATPDPIILTQGATQQIALNATFSNGSSATIPSNLGTYSVFTSRGASNVSASGLVSFLNVARNDTVRASFAFGGATRTDDVLVRTVEFDVSNNSTGQVVRNTTATPNYAASFRDSDGVTVLNVLPNTTFALQTAVSGVSINSTTGAITVASNATLGNFVVVATWVDGRPSSNPLATGRTFQDTLTFQVVNQLQ